MRNNTERSIQEGRRIVLSAKFDNDVAKLIWTTLKAKHLTVNELFKVLGEVVVRYMVTGRCDGNQSVLMEEAVGLLGKIKHTDGADVRLSNVIAFADNPNTSGALAYLIDARSGAVEYSTNIGAIIEAVIKAVSQVRHRRLTSLARCRNKQNLLQLLDELIVEAEEADEERAFEDDFNDIRSDYDEQKRVASRLAHKPKKNR